MGVIQRLYQKQSFTGGYKRLKINSALTNREDTFPTASLAWIPSRGDWREYPSGETESTRKKLLSALSRYVKLYLYCLHDAVSDVIDYLWEREHARRGL